MDTIDFNKNDFPLTTNVLGFLQTAAQLIEKLAGIISGNYIISGCKAVGASTSAGYVVVNGEIMPFAGGVTQSYVRVINTSETVTVNDGTYTKTTKQLIFGAGSGQIAWSSFRSASNVIENQTLPLLSGSAGLSRAIIEVGDWNMDENTSKLVSLPMPVSSIRSVNVLIRSDNASAMFYKNLESSGAFVLQASVNNIYMTRLAETGGFDSGAYDSIAYNRGWIVIDYIA